MNDARPDDLAFVGRLVSDRFRTLRLVGAGGMGAVYEAEDMLGGPRVALKRLRPEFMRDEEVVRRFVQEGQTAAQIVHPNIVNVLATGQDPKDLSLFIVQEFLTGIDLRQRLMGGVKLPPRETVGIVIPIIDGLAAAHSHGIVHRDIKPANIFLATGPSGEVIPKLIDFGVSKILGPVGEGLSKTRTGIAVGTPHYMSPEQIRGDKTLDESSDVWAVGVVLYLMLVGQHPFKADSIPKTLLKIITEPAPRLDAIAPGIPRQLADAVANAMQIDRRLRHASTTAFLEALLACPLPPDPGSNRASAAEEFGRTIGPRAAAIDLGATVFNAGMAAPIAPPPGYLTRETTDVGALNAARAQADAARVSALPGGSQRVSAVPDPSAGSMTPRPSQPGNRRVTHGMRQALPALQPRESVVAPAPPQPPVTAATDARVRWLAGVVVVLFVSVAGMVAVRFRARSNALARASVTATSVTPAASQEPPTTRIMLIPSARPEASPLVAADASSDL